MIGVSDRWRQAQAGTIVPESFIEITYKVTDPGAQESALLEHNGVALFSNPDKILENQAMSPPRFATLEHNLWTLDGRFDLMPDEKPYGDTGYVAEAAEPVVTIHLPEVRNQAIPGLSIQWSSAYGEYATRYRITAYNGVTPVATQEFENSDIQTTAIMAIAGYDSIAIEVLDWVMPHRRARMESVFLGAMQSYTKEQLVSFTHSQTADILSAELPKNSVTFSLNNATGIWNPENPTGNVQYLADRQEISVRYGYKLGNTIEWINAGTFWISEWNTPSNGLEASFTARDMIEFMDDIYTGPRNGTLYDIAMRALMQANIPATFAGTQRYYVSEDLRNTRVDFREDSTNYPISVILQMCANAGCCVMRQDRNGRLRIEPMGQNYTGYSIGKFTSYSHPEYSMSKPLCAVNVNDGMGLTVASPTGETVAIDNGFIQSELIAKRVADWAASILQYRKVLRGEFRADPRLDVLDIISVESKYGANNAIVVTSIDYSYSGAFKGAFTGRIVPFKPEVWHSGELISGEI